MFISKKHNPKIGLSLWDILVVNQVQRLLIVSYKIRNMKKNKLWKKNYWSWTVLKIAMYYLVYAWEVYMNVIDSFSMIAMHNVADSAVWF